MNDDVEQPGERLVKWPWVVAALYLLSMGPFWALREHGVVTRGGMVERSLVTFYLPLELLARHVPPFKALLKWYLEFFAPV